MNQLLIVQEEEEARRRKISKKRLGGQLRYILFRLLYLSHLHVLVLISNLYRDRDSESIEKVLRHRQFFSQHLLTVR